MPRLRAPKLPAMSAGVRQGDGYFPLKLSEKRLARFPRPAGTTSGVIGRPASDFLNKHGATGEGILKGLMPDNTVAGLLAP